MSRGFRIWDKQTKSYTKSYECDREFVLNSSGELMELYSNHDGTWEYRFADTDRFIVEHDTGLKDRNAKEICEGDIIKFLYSEMSISPTGVVCFDHGEYYIMDRKLDDGTCHIVEFYDYNTPDEDFEVVGNIHENGDLFK